MIARGSTRLFELANSPTRFFGWSLPPPKLEDDPGRKNTQHTVRFAEPSRSLDRLTPMARLLADFELKQHTSSGAVETTGSSCVLRFCDAQMRVMACAARYAWTIVEGLLIRGKHVFLPIFNEACSQVRLLEHKPRKLGEAKMRALVGMIFGTAIICGAEPTWAQTHDPISRLHGRIQRG